MDVLGTIGSVATPGTTGMYSLAEGNWVWDKLPVAVPQSPAQFLPVLQECL